MHESTSEILLAAFRGDLEASLPTDKVTAAAAALASILYRRSGIIADLLAVVPARRLGREMAITALHRNEDHLSVFIREHCPDDLLLLTIGLAQDVASLLGLPRHRTTDSMTYFETYRSTPPVFASVPRKPADYTTIDVFYATDRKSTGSREPDKAFGADRAELSFGQAQVTIPRDHRMGKLEEPTWWKLEFSPNPAKHVTIKSLTQVDQDAFFAGVGLRAEQGDGQALVFLHGYNVTFDQALRRTGQLAYDLNFAGAPILYSWPSNGALADYTQDATNADWAREHLVAFLGSLAACTEVRTIHLVAHSMGNRVLLNALDWLAANRHQARFGQTILTAPDVDADIFRDVVNRCRALAARTTLYASKTDKAMKASRKVNGHPRAGDAEYGLVVMAGLDTIDATDVDTSFLGHGYYGDNRSVLSDLFYAIRGIDALDRHGLHRMSFDTLTYWAFNK